MADAFDTAFLYLDILKGKTYEKKHFLDGLGISGTGFSACCQYKELCN